MKLLQVLLLLFISAASTAQTGIYQHQLQLVDSVRAYIQGTLHLNIGNDFYTKWSTHKDSMYYFVYISNAYKVESILPGAYIAYDNEDSAIAAAGKYSRQGYHTLVYRTAGTSTAELTPKLLSYPDEAIAFIMVHEAVHRHINSFHFKKSYPYDFNESLCDAIANNACVAMGATTSFLNKDAADKQKLIFKDVYTFINWKREELDSSATSQHIDIFIQTLALIKYTIQYGNQFQKDRMLYVVNNAYFLRYQAYTMHYFEVLQMLDKGKSINSTIKSIYKEEVLKKKKGT